MIRVNPALLPAVAASLVLWLAILFGIDSVFGQQNLPVFDRQQCDAIRWVQSDDSPTITSWDIGYGKEAGAPVVTANVLRADVGDDATYKTTPCYVILRQWPFGEGGQYLFVRARTTNPPTACDAGTCSAWSSNLEIVGTRQ